MLSLPERITLLITRHIFRALSFEEENIEIISDENNKTIGIVGE